MADLLRKPFGSHGKVHEITPQSAGWRYVGFSLYRLRSGEVAAETTKDREVILGSCHVIKRRAVFVAEGLRSGAAPVTTFQCAIARMR